MTAAPPLAPTPEPRRSRGRVVAILVAVAAVVAVVLLVAPRFMSGPSATSSPAASVEGVVPPDAGVVAEGRAVPVAWAEVAPATGGRVTSIPVTEGYKVRVGDVLLRLDDAAARLDLDSALAAADGAAAATARATAALAQARANLLAAQAGIDQAVAGRRAAQAARDALPGGTPRAQKRQADAQVDQAAAGVDSARAQRTAAQAGVRQAQASLDGATADEARAKASVATAHLALDRLAVKAPIDGTVVSVAPRKGDLLAPGAVAVRVADESGWRFETTDLSETSIARVRPGAAASITVDGLPGQEIRGTVESVGGFGASSQGDVVYRVVVAPSGAVPDGLRWNMTVTMDIDGSAAGG